MDDLDSTLNQMVNRLLEYDEIAFIDSMIRPMDLSTNESDDE